MQSAYDRFLRTLSNRTRLALIQSLIARPRNVSQLTEELGIHQTSVSHGLKRLLDCGFVLVEPNGRERLYSVNQKTIKPYCRAGRTLLVSGAAPCGFALPRLPPHSPGPHPPSQEIWCA